MCRVFFGAFDGINTKKLLEMEDLFADPKPANPKPAFRFFERSYQDEYVFKLMICRSRH